MKKQIERLKNMNKEERNRRKEGERRQ